jgi:hypothetical protein
VTADVRAALERALQTGDAVALDVELPAGRCIQVVGAVRAVDGRCVLLTDSTGAVRRMPVSRIGHVRLVPPRQQRGRGYGDPPAEDVDRVGEVLNLKGLPDDDSHWGERSSLKVET